MEAVGQLTGGISHDFSNLLHVIIGNLRLLKNDFVGQPDVVCEILNNAISAGGDGADLAAKLLSFSRSKLLVATSVD
jgi:two-component system, cell cycle sensor histidine kinase and response regulator CckA